MNRHGIRSFATVALICVSVGACRHRIGLRGFARVLQPVELVETSTAVVGARVGVKHQKARAVLSSDRRCDVHLKVRGRVLGDRVVATRDGEE